MNSVILIGRLTADPTCHAGEKHESATFRLAVPRKGSDGADFVDIVTFDKLAATWANGSRRAGRWPWLDGCTSTSGPPVRVSHWDWADCLCVAADSVSVAGRRDGAH